MNNTPTTFESATIEVIRFENVDVLTASNVELPWVPFGMPEELSLIQALEDEE